MPNTELNLIFRNDFSSSRLGRSPSLTHNTLSARTILIAITFTFGLLNSTIRTRSEQRKMERKNWLETEIELNWLQVLETANGKQFFNDE